MLGDVTVSFHTSAADLTKASMSDVGANRSRLLRRPFAKTCTTTLVVLEHLLHRGVRFEQWLCHKFRQGAESRRVKPSLGVCLLPSVRVFQVPRELGTFLLDTGPELAGRESRNEE